MITLAPEQVGALEQAQAWLDEPYHAPYFKLFGYAGTGKTTLARHLGNMRTGTLYAAFTGKAASVLTAKGCPATTLHKLIMAYDGEYRNPTTNRLEPRFVVNPASELAFSKLLIVDEVSMVNTQMAEDILSFNVPVLVLGDPAQLPPVEGGGYFTMGQPDVMLREIHRQEAGSQALDLATNIRTGKKYVRRSAMSYHEALGYDQVIVGTNSLRWRLTNALRKTVGFDQPEEPQPGDKVICLKNDMNRGIMNGETFTVLDYVQSMSRLIVKDDNDNELDFTVWPQAFSREGEAEVKGLGHAVVSTRAYMTFGWAITCHKAQGSQWGRVLIADEAKVFGKHAGRWLYTAVTRAETEATIVRPSGLSRFKLPPSVASKIEET